MLCGKPGAMCLCTTTIADCRMQHLNGMPIFSEARLVSLRLINLKSNPDLDCFKINQFKAQHGYIRIVSDCTDTSDDVAGEQLPQRSTHVRQGPTNHVTTIVLATIMGSLLSSVMSTSLMILWLKVNYINLLLVLTFEVTNDMCTFNHIV